MIMAIVWYAKYNGTTSGHAPSFSDGDIYVWYKQIMLWMSVVWFVGISNLLEWFADAHSIQKISISTKLASVVSRELREISSGVGLRQK
jgi:hypothetical protein